MPSGMYTCLATQSLQCCGVIQLKLASSTAALCLQAAEATKAKANGVASAGGAHAASGLLADLALLQGADRLGSQAGAGDGAEQWKPPENQKGDGRTKLNDLLGY